MSSDEFMVSPLAGLFSENNWSVSCRDVSDSDGENKTVIVSVAFKDDYAGDNSGVTMSFRLDDLDNIDIDSLEADVSSVLDIFDEAEETNRIEKELIAENKYGGGDPDVLLNNIDVYTKNPENIIVAASVKADTNFITYGTLEEISDFIDRAKDSVEDLSRNVLIPYKKNEISQKQILNVTGYADIDSSSFFEIQRFEKIGGEDYVRASKVTDGERMPARCYPIVEDIISKGGNRKPEWVVNFGNGDVIPLSSVRFVDPKYNDISADEVLKNFMEYGHGDNESSSGSRMEDNGKRSVIDGLEDALNQINQNNGNNSNSDPSEVGAGERIKKEEPPKPSKPKHKSKAKGREM